MDVVKITCPHCGQRLSITLDQLDLLEPCPNCSELVDARKCIPPSPPRNPPAASPEQPTRPIGATADGKDKAGPSKEQPPPSQPPASSKSASSAKTDRPQSSPGTASRRDDSHDTERSLFRWPGVSRSFSISLAIHVALVFLAGSAVLFHQIEQAADFTAGNDGFLIDPGQMAPPADPAGLVPESQVAPPSAPVPAPISAVATTSLSPKWQAPVQSLQARSFSDSLKNTMTSMGNKLPQGGGGGAMGKMGTTHMATIFGKRVQASKLGVILDVSSSAHPHLAGAIEEIQRGFANATMILYPGCGLTEVQGKSGHVIRKLSTIPRKELETDPGGFSTAGFMIDALKVAGFDQMVKRPTLKDTLFISWYEDKDSGGNFMKLVGQTQVAFAELLNRRVDAIYWFSDFEDKVTPPAAEKLTHELMFKHVRLYLHNFAGGGIPAYVEDMAQKTGGMDETAPPK